ncbi:MAG TPA: adenylate/guanylate cyclase domain-containing protein [Methyloceanibacter sp.]|nr:adenylate/guanylate cyclase domain-containing protein [Methyloceanibacter sp.]
MAEPETAPVRVERRLAAILAADVVGYSHLVEQDEAGTIARLKALRKETLEPILARHGGRIVKLMGDGALIELASVVEAVQAAIECQRATAEHEAGRPPNERIAFRIGINLGDIVIEPDGDILGDGVNIAARLEQLADPGGICVSEAVIHGLRAGFPTAIQDLGPQRLKNIADPVRAYRLLLDTAAARPMARRPKPLGASRLVRPAVAAALALLVVLAAAAGGWRWWHGRADVEGETALRRAGSIAVLPLTNLSGDPRWERLAGGITEDIITDLAREPDLLVIARDSTLAYKGKAVDVRDVGKQLGVRYVLEGSLQADAGHVRMTAQLIDTATGGHLWASRYDRPESDLFAVQDDIVQNVTGALGGSYGRIAGAARSQAKRKSPASLEAYELYLLGIEEKHKLTKESLAEAKRLMTRATEVDPGFARGWVGLGMVYFNLAISGGIDGPVAATRLWGEYTRKAVALDPADPLARVMLAAIRAREGDLGGAAADFDRAVTMAPSDAYVLALTSFRMVPALGRVDDGLRYIERAMILNPAAPPLYYRALGEVQFYAGAYGKAVEALRQAPLDNPEVLFFLAMAQAQTGAIEESRKAAERIRSEFPSFTVDSFIRDWPVADADALAKLREGATKAGLLPLATN